MSFMMQRDPGLGGGGSAKPKPKPKKKQKPKAMPPDLVLTQQSDPKAPAKPVLPIGPALNEARNQIAIGVADEQQNATDRAVASNPAVAALRRENAATGDRLDASGAVNRGETIGVLPTADPNQVQRLR
ncbi:MAG: hypothetical protein AAGH92_08600, partial [Planctomycetota bacterium]